jgi:plastocyanin
MRKMLAAVAATALAAGLGGTALAAGKTRTVKVGDNWFVRSGAHRHTIHVRKGTTLKFRWVGSGLHDVKVTKGPRAFGSSAKTSGTYTHKLTKRGTYTLKCTIHPSSMILKVRVR